MLQKSYKNRTVKTQDINQVKNIIFLTFTTSMITLQPVLIFSHCFKKQILWKVCNQSVHNRLLSSSLILDTHALLLGSGQNYLVWQWHKKHILQCFRLYWVHIQYQSLFSK